MKLKLDCSMHKNIDFKSKVEASMREPKASLRGLYKEREGRMDRG